MPTPRALAAAERPPLISGMTHEPAGGRDAGPEDAELVTRIRAGDESAFETVFHRHVTHLCALAYRYVESRDLAADLVQDVFLRIWRNRDHWELHETLRGYLYRATRNRALDFLKHDGVERRWAAASAREHAGDESLTSIPLPPDDATSDLAAELERALEWLPERRRQVFLLRWRHELSYAEIAELMGTTPKTVENQMTRALRTLREHLRGGSAPGASS